MAVCYNKLKLRWYQELGISQLRDSFSKGYKRTIIWLATGGGKSAMFASLIKSLDTNNKKVLLVMRRRTLVFQMANTIEKFVEIKPSIIMGNEKGFNPGNNIQVCSIDTIHSRIKKPEYQFLLNYDYIMVDEVHDCTSPKYKEFLNRFDSKSWIGMTASPFPIGNKYLTEWEDLVNPVTAKQLRDEGYLVPERTYAPRKISTKGIKTIAGEFDQKQLAERAMESKIVGDTIEVYLKRGENRPALGFAVNIEHSKLIVERFKQSGIPAVHIDQSHTQEERDSAIKSLYTGDNKILFSVNVFSTGTDVPIAATLLLARPTKSEILYVQQVGRILRPYKQCVNCNNHCGAESVCFRCGNNEFKNIKKDAIILDQANNCERFGLAYDIRYARIRPPEHKKKKDANPELEIKTKTCEECYAVYSATESRCPLCEHTNAKTEREIKEEQGELERVKSKELRYARYIKIKNDLMKLSNPKWKESAKWLKLHKIYGDEIFEFKQELEIPSWAKAQVTKLLKIKR